jgi:TolA-binding protein
VNLYADIANLQNNGSFDTAATDWQKFIAKYPQDPLTPKAKHYLGICFVQLEKYAEAANTLAELRKSHPQFELLEDTLLQLGWSNFKLADQDPTKLPVAAEAFDALVKQYPQGKHLDQALYFLGEAQYREGKKTEAVASYDRLVKELAQSKLRLDALYALGVTLEELKQYKEAGQAYDLFLKDYATSELVPEVRMRKGETLLSEGDVPGAAKLFAEVAAVPNFQLADYALYRQAFCLAQQNQFAEAGALYGKVAEQFAKSERVNLSDCQLAAGRCYYRAEKFPEASQWFTKSIALKDDNAAEAAHWQCRILIKSQKLTEAIALADEFIKTVTKPALLVPLRLDRTDAYYEFPQHRERTIDLYAEIATQHADHPLAPQALYNAAFAALTARKFDVGHQHATAFLTKYPQDKLLPDVKYVAAECLLQQNTAAKAAEAEKVYGDLIATQGMHPEVSAWRIRQALALYLQKKYAEVVAALTPVQLTVPEQQAEAQYLIGVSQFYADQFAAAEKALDTAFNAAPKWRQADETLLVLSRARRKLDNTAGAIATATKLIAEYPESKVLDQAHYRLGEYHYGSEDFAKALAEYDVVLTKFPTSTFTPFALYGKGWSHIKLKEYPPASQAFGTLLEKFPDHSLVAETRFARAMSRRLEGNFATSLEDAAAFLATNPQGTPRSDALYEKGLAEVGLNKNDLAIATFEQILKEQPDYPATDKVLYELGWAYKTLEKAEPALAQFARLAKDFAASPLAGEAFFHVAEDSYAKKKYAEALTSYTAARERASNAELGEKATYKLAWANYQLRQYEGAHKEFRDQLEKYPQGPLANDALFMQAESLFKLEKYSEALPLFQRAIQVKLTNPAMEVLAYLHGGQSASQMKQWDAAVLLLAEVPKRYADSPYVAEAHYETGYALQNAAKATEALQEYSLAASKSRGEVGARARFMSGEVFFGQQKYKEAIQEFERGMYGFGGENAPAEVKNWQAKSAYEAGRCSEVQAAAATEPAAKSKFAADARKYYTFAATKTPDAPVGQEAKKRLEVLSKL